MTNVSEEGRRVQRSSNAAFDDLTVARIKKHLLNGAYTVRELAQVHGVGAETIRRIGRGETYAWVEPEGSVADGLQAAILEAKGAPVKTPSQVELEAAASAARFRAQFGELVKQEEPAEREAVQTHAVESDALSRMLKAASAERAHSPEEMLKSLDQPKEQEK